MKNLPIKFILSIHPKEYLKQGLSNCGLYSIKGILSAFDLDRKSRPQDYHSNLLSKLTSVTWGRNYYIDILNSHGIKSEMKFAENTSNAERLYLLKRLLTKNTPVMIRIGNGYLSDEYNSVLGKLMPHWITLWGYDDDKNVFYIYDSALPRKHWNKTLRAGNTSRTYEEILRDWNFGRLNPWAWTVTGPNNFSYIEIKRSVNGRS